MVDGNAWKKKKRGFVYQPGSLKNASPFQRRKGEKRARGERETREQETQRRRRKEKGILQVGSEEVGSAGTRPAAHGPQVGERHVLEYIYIYMYVRSMLCFVTWLDGALKGVPLPSQADYIQHLHSWMQARLSTSRGQTERNGRQRKEIVAGTRRRTRGKILLEAEVQMLSSIILVLYHVFMYQLLHYSSLSLSLSLDLNSRTVSSFLPLFLSFINSIIAQLAPP